MKRERTNECRKAWINFQWIDSFLIHPLLLAYVTIEHKYEQFDEKLKKIAKMKKWNTKKYPIERKDKNVQREKFKYRSYTYSSSTTTSIAAAATGTRLWLPRESKEQKKYRKKKKKNVYEIRKCGKCWEYEKKYYFCSSFLM